MYNPPHFEVNDLPRLHAAMQAVPLASMGTAGPEGLTASHLPLLLAPDAGPYGSLRGHMAKANPQGSLPEGTEAMIVFQGPDAYISPSYYPSKQAGGKVVPTWNYIAVHAYGRLRWITEAAALRALVEDLTSRHESGRSPPWEVADAPENYIAAMLAGIIGFEIAIERIEGKFKLSQNRNAADRQGVKSGLTADGRADFAALME